VANGTQFLLRARRTRGSAGQREKYRKPPTGPREPVIVNGAMRLALVSSARLVAAKEEAFGNIIEFEAGGGDGGARA
jgi:hypothetical protein